MMQEPLTPMYDKLAEYAEGRIFALVFIGWLARELPDDTKLCDLDVESLIMQHLEIDMVALEKERLAEQEWHFHLDSPDIQCDIPMPRVKPPKQGK